MPIETYWANDTQSILIEKFHDVWTWQQVSEACQTKIYPQLNNISHPVVLIQDMMGSHWTPTTNLLKDVQAMMQTPCPDNMVMLLVVSGNPSIDVLVISAYQRFDNEGCVYQACSTVNQAIRVAKDYLSQQD
jgi:hypothetical protein